MNLRTNREENIFFNNFYEQKKNALNVTFIESFSDLILLACEELLKGINKTFQTVFSLHPNVFILVTQESEQFLQKHRQIN